MRHKKTGFIIGSLLIAFSVVLLSCATDKASLKIPKSLPQSELAYYNDSFDKLREDLWDKAGYINLEEQMQNFKLADMRFENSKLIIRTKTGSFSKGGLGAKYELRGDFDIQLDCRIDFIKTPSGMDQLLNILVIDKTRKIGKGSIVYIALSKGERMDQALLNTGCLINGTQKRGKSIKTENFNGTLRIWRNGKDISTLYKEEGNVAWTYMNTFRVTDNDMLFGFQLRNYFNKRATIGATSSITAEFDNFKINAVQEIIEEEI